MKVLLIDTTHPILEEMLSQNGIELIDGTHWDVSEILNQLHSFEGVVVRSRIPIDETFFEHATSLKCIGRFGAGLENINLSVAAKHKVECFNVPEGNRQAVAEHTLALILNLLNHIRRADREVREGVWRRHENTGMELSGKTVGIIGLGNMGQAFARVLSGFNVEIIAYDPYIQPWPNDDVTSVPLEELRSRADIVSIHTPLTDETKGWIDLDFLSKLKPGALVINTARGPILKIEDLLTSIESGHIRGAGLDVLEFESSAFKLQLEGNPVFQKLIESDKVILTPHIGGWTKEAFEKMGRFLAEKMIRTLNS